MRSRVETTLAAAVLGLALAGPVAGAPITIGPGPVRGVDRAGVTWYEDFQDWTHADLRALDDASPADPMHLFNDGQDASRDLVAFYFRDEGANVYFRADFFDLALGAENGGLDLYLAIDAAGGGQVWLPDFLDCQTDRPWELCLSIYSSGTVQGTNYRLYDATFNQVANAYLGSSFHSQIDAVEFGIRRQALLDAGWNGTSPLGFQVFTARDLSETTCTGGGRSSDITDAIVDDDRGCSDGTLNGAIASNVAAGRVFWASIAHGNQSVNKSSDIAAHIYDPPATTGIPGGTGFQRTLDTHAIFRVPINLHPSGTLTIACNWARRPGGAADPQDGPAFLARIRDFVDADQSQTPGSLLGGVLAEHILPYFEGPVNAASFAATDALNQAVYGVSAAEARVLHVPERVIRSLPTGLAPLDGLTFEDLLATPYVATYLDEVTHLHHWFYGGETCQPDQAYRHKLHRINGVYCFMINDREDQGKFGNHDGGAVLDTRRSLLEKALYGDASQFVVVFDDWEALAGKSFDPVNGSSIPNNNPNQYHNTVRWIANHPWVQVANLADLLGLALADPARFVVDHGTRTDLSLQTYEYLKHSSEDSYHNWYYNEAGGVAGNEQSFYDLVPVVTGPQGDYRARGATPAQDGPPLPSGMPHGDLNTPGTLLYATWAALQAAPAGKLRTLGEHAYLAMIYETAWHEEDQVGYADSDCYGSWLAPDATWDGVNTWALRLQNHVRGAGMYAAAAAWADSVRAGLHGPGIVQRAVDLDFDGEAEYVLRNDRVWAAFERYGGRCVLAAAYDSVAQDAEVVIGAPYTNPSAPGEEESVGAAANRCSGFKDMNGGVYADVPYVVTPVQEGWRFASPDGKVVKIFNLKQDEAEIFVAYEETVAGPLYVRIGLSPNPLDLATNGHANLSGGFDGSNNIYSLVNAAGGGARLDLGSATWNPTPADAGFDRRNLALTEEVEFYGNGSFVIGLRLIAGAPATSDAEPSRPARLWMSPPWPSPSRGPAHIALRLPEAGPVRLDILDVAGRRVASRDLGHRPAGPLTLDLDPRAPAGAPLPAGLYFVRLATPTASTTQRWVLLSR